MLRSHRWVFYFCAERNVGDEIGPTLVKNLYGERVVTFPGVLLFNHLLSVGSILGLMNRKSVVWGSGFISRSDIRGCTDIGEIRALRGELSRSLVERKFGVTLECPLGDPALLVPLIHPINDLIPKLYKVGLVVHYAEVDLIDVERLEQGGDIFPISVELDVGVFVQKLQQCDYIISSSLHGLILADAYGIPNARLLLSDRIVGGDFKFRDYYSTTDSPGAHVNYFDLRSGGEFPSISEIERKCYVKNYRYQLSDLKDSFPKSANYRVIKS